MVGPWTFQVEATSGDSQTATQWLVIRVVNLLQPSELCSNHLGSDIATFEDANLEVEVRRVFGVGSGLDALTCAVVSLDVVRRFSGFLDAGFSDVESLVGIQNVTKLQELWLNNNSITDIGSISDLAALDLLYLNNNPITDISPLSGLRRLTDLDLSFTAISDVSALSSLTNLGWLRLNDNSITDISALSELSGFGSIHNPSRDGMLELYLDNNPDLSNIQPLLDNIWLGADHLVSLGNTNVSCTDVAALEAKGVAVDSDCP